MKQKNPTTLKRSSIASAVLAVGSLIGRIVMGVEMHTIKNSHAGIVVMGSRNMSRSEYLEFAAKMNTRLVIFMIVFALVAAGLYAMYKKSREQ